MSDKPFFRESNRWRFIGLVVMFAAVFIPRQVVLTFENAWLPREITTAGVFVIAGVVLLVYPNIREGIKLWRAK